MFVIIKLRYRSVNLYGKIWLNRLCSCWLLLIGREYSCMLGNERKKESVCIQKLVPCTSLCFKTNEVWECRATYLLVCVNCCMCRHLGKIHLPCVYVWPEHKLLGQWQKPGESSQCKSCWSLKCQNKKVQLRCKKKKKNHIMCEIGGRQSLLFLFFFFENKN